MEINSLLRVVFNDSSWLERAEYDGAEYWVYKNIVEPCGNGEIDFKEYKDIKFYYIEDNKL